MYLQGVVLMMLAAPVTARAGCDARAVTDAVARAEVAFVQMNGDTFAGSMAETDTALSCQTEPLSAIQIAAVHRVRALDAFFSGDEPSVVLAFEALLATMPGYELPVDIAPVGHPLRKLFDEARLFSVREVFVLPEPREGWLTIDGRRGIEAPAARPFVFQRFDPTGLVLDTEYVAVGRPVPVYPASTPAAQPLTTQIIDEPRKRKVSGALVGSGLLLAAAGATAYGLAFPARADYDEAVLQGDKPLIQRAYTQTNVLTGVGIGAVTSGLSLVLVGVF